MNSTEGAMVWKKENVLFLVGLKEVASTRVCQVETGTSLCRVSPEDSMYGELQVELPGHMGNEKA